MQTSLAPVPINHIVVAVCMSVCVCVMRYSRILLLYDTHTYSAICSRFLHLMLRQLFLFPLSVPEEASMSMTSTYNVYITIIMRVYYICIELSRKEAEHNRLRAART
jgi:hypothetical protein